MIQIKSHADLQAQLGQAENALIDFWAPWCGPCKSMMPNLEALQAANPALTIVKVNVDELPEVAKAFGVRSIPTLALTKNGQIANTVVGAQTLEQLVAFVDL